MFVNQLPSTISKEAFENLSVFTVEDRIQVLPDLEDLAGWGNLRSEFEKKFTPLCNDAKKHYQPIIKEISLGGVPAIEINPSEDSQELIIYLHGGAFTLFSASSTLFCSVPVSSELNRTVIAVDYTLAPEANWETILDQILTAVQSLIKLGHPLNKMIFFGDSAGGSLVAGTILKMRDKGLGMPKAAVLWSPWSDITYTGDTYKTLKDADPVLYYPECLEKCAKAYAPKDQQKHPYVSPVYGDYSKGFPKTLIQVGTKEIFLSNAVRQFRALDDAGVDVKLDVYEGMWHVFQGLSWHLPESFLARRNMKKFLSR